jgi:hypothetical protein
VYLLGRYIDNLLCYYTMLYNVMGRWYNLKYSLDQHNKINQNKIQENWMKDRHILTRNKLLKMVNHMNYSLKHMEYLNNSFSSYMTFLSVGCPNDLITHLEINEDMIFNLYINVKRRFSFFPQDKLNAYRILIFIKRKRKHIIRVVSNMQTCLHAFNRHVNLSEKVMFIS